MIWALPLLANESADTTDVRYRELTEVKVNAERLALGAYAYRLVATMTAEEIKLLPVKQ